MKLMIKPIQLNRVYQVTWNYNALRLKQGDEVDLDGKIELEIANMDTLKEKTKISTVEELVTFAKDLLYSEISSMLQTMNAIDIIESQFTVLNQLHVLFRAKLAEFGINLVDLKFEHIYFYRSF